jgi:hypothetical protein
VHRFAAALGPFGSTGQPEHSPVKLQNETL